MIKCAFVLLYLYTVDLCIFNRVNKWQPYNTSTVIYPHWIYDIFQLIDITFQNFKEINGSGWPPIDIRREGRALYTGLYLQYVKPGSELRCSGRVNTFCSSTCSTGQLFLYDAWYSPYSWFVFHQLGVS
jgi:hypothetical protein